MYKTASYIMFVIGFFMLGLVSYPLGIMFANKGTRAGEDTRVAGMLNTVGFAFTLFMVIVMFLF